jgi:hypothetical protein
MNNPLITTQTFSFAGVDTEIYCVPSFGVESEGGTKAVKIINISTISYSIYRSKSPVNILGYPNQVGVARGYASIAGTIVFTVGKERVLEEVRSAYEAHIGSDFVGAVRLDQLPPLDFILVFSNEYGDVSRLIIAGVEFLNEGQVHSVSDLITENSVNYIAQDVYPMEYLNDKHGALYTFEQGEQGGRIVKYDPGATLKKAEELLEERARLWL